MKSENRRPKTEGKPNSEIRKPEAKAAEGQAGVPKTPEVGAIKEKQVAALREQERFHAGL